MSFEWQTEDERSWEQPAGPEGNEGPRNARRWAWVLLFVALIATGAYLGWQQVEERVEAGAETVRDEVRASYALAESAALARDQELFVSLLSGRSATWTDTQRERAEHGLLFGETGRLFAFRRAGAAQGEAAVELNPDLTEAFLSVPQPFVVDAGSGLTETIVLTQTHVFRRGSQRWLLSPPDDTYWGEWQTRNGRVLQMAYPQRDEEIALRLHEDLERKLMEMCRTVIDCPLEFGMLLRLETDVQSVVPAASGEERLAGGRELTLPAPSLVGLPQDEAAYAALFRGYARHLITGALVELSGYQCCDMALFQEALMAWQLSRLSLRSAPLQPDTYVSLVEAPLGVDRLAFLSRSYAPMASDAEAPREVHAFIDFLRSRLALRQDALGDMQRSLQESRSFWTWVADLTEYEPTNPDALQSDWSAFVWERAREAQAVAQAVPAEVQPQQDLIAMCGNQTLDIYRYSTADGQWTREVPAGVAFAALASLPGGDGYMMTGQLPDQEFTTGLVTYLQRGSEAPFALVQQEPLNSALLPWSVREPNGPRMLVWVFNTGNESDGGTRNALLDPATCAPEGCALNPIAGLPVWSPTGRLALALDTNNGGILYLPQGATSWQSLDRESAIFPFWIDERRFGLVEAGDFSERQTLYAVDVASGEMTALVTGEELGEALGAGGRQDALMMSFALRHPLQQDRIVVGAVERMNPTHSYLFSLTVESDALPGTDAAAPLRLLDTFEGSFNNGWFAPNYQDEGERYVVLPLTHFQTGEEGPRITLYDLQENETVLSSTLEPNSGLMAGPGLWSSDRRWFAHALSRAIHLLAPAPGRSESYRQLIFHDFERCESPVWVNRRE